jgi:mRNA interferase HigB
MRLIKKQTLERFVAEHPDAGPSLGTWASSVEAAAWYSMTGIVQAGLCRPSPIGSDRVVFDIAGNKYRLICQVRFARASSATRPAAQGVVYVLWFGTHGEYDQVDPATVKFQ